LKNAAGYLKKKSNRLAQKLQVKNNEVFRRYSLTRLCWRLPFSSSGRDYHGFQFIGYPGLGKNTIKAFISLPSRHRRRGPPGADVYYISIRPPFFTLRRLVYVATGFTLLLLLLCLAMRR
jgi:hypothetical protein